MNAQPKFPVVQFRSSHTTGAKVSQSELARFLMRLADLYRDPKTGNRALSAALRELADQLARSTFSTKGAIEPTRKRVSKADTKPKQEKPQAAFQWLRNLDTNAAKAFISDESKTKAELLELASERLSIPRARLMKLSMPEIREEIRSALLHEESLQIISQEAERSGANRSS